MSEHHFVIPLAEHGARFGRVPESLVVVAGRAVAHRIYGPRVYSGGLGQILEAVPEISGANESLCFCAPRLARFGHEDDEELPEETDAED